MQDNDFKNVLNSRIAETERILKANLPEENKYSKTVRDAMEYSVTAGGKRLRPLFMQAAYELFSCGDNVTIGYELSAFMSAIEYIHTYSLVHDDLPAMDNDEYRRGRLTTWKVYGDGMGVLAGDALLNYAFEMTSKAALRAIENKDPDMAERCIRASMVLSDKAGIYGMIGGQCADICAEGKGSNVSKEELLFIHEHKTGCLIEAALMVGGILGGAGKEDVDKLEKIGSDIGMAFQIRDDILDVIGNTEELGKKVGSDEANQKTTYVTLNGLENSQKEVERVSYEALTLLDELPGDKAFLNSLTKMLIGRTK